jgi:hypothetical protein
MANLDSELLTSLSLEELQALAEGLLAPTLRLACPSCNRYKTVRQTEFDLATQQDVALFHPHRQS